MWNTNPSPENRKIMKLTSMIEAGESKLFQVMEYFNTIHSSRTPIMDVPSRNSSNVQEEAEITKDFDSTVSYEDAIILNSSNRLHQRILNQHHSIKIWDSFEKYTRDYIQSVEEDNMDDEEEGSATSSRDRKEAKKEKKIETFSISVLQSRREIIFKFLKNYAIALIKAEKIENKKTGLVDLAMLLIVLKQLQEVTHKKYFVKSEIGENKSTQYIYEISGNLATLDSFSGAVLNLLGTFINSALKATWETPNDEYTQKKLNHYRKTSAITALFSLSIMKLSYNRELFNDWFDVTAYNILKVFNTSLEGYGNLVENLINDSHIENLSHKEINEIIRLWITTHENKEYTNRFFENEITGICLVHKYIPSEENPKFLKLSRPGFNYHEQLHDFIADTLFDLRTNNWFDTNPRKIDEL